MTALAGFDGHQGVALVVEPRQFASLDDILERATERSEPPFVLVLDSLEDPQNVGTLLRSAEAAGVHGVIFPVRRQAPLTPAAVKASAGAVEHLLLCPVDDLAGALADLHGQGLRIAGSEADAPLTARQSDLRGPLALVVGSEGQGLGPAVRRRCDLFMRIPMRGAVGSLNAAVAGSILLFEAVAQRDPDGRARTQPAAAWPVPRRRDPGDEASPTSAADWAEPSDAAGSTDTDAPSEAPEPGDSVATAGLETSAATASTRTKLVPAGSRDQPEPDQPRPRRARPKRPATDRSTAEQPGDREPDTAGAATMPPGDVAAASDEDLLPGAAAAKPGRPKRPRAQRD